MQGNGGNEVQGKDTERSVRQCKVWVDETKQGIVRNGKETQGWVEKARQSKRGIGKAVGLMGGRQGKARQGQEKRSRKVKVGDG